jgi:ribosome-associated protein
MTADDSMHLMIGDVAIDESQLQWSYSRSSGPGGQNVNKLSTRVTISLDLRHARGLNADLRSRLLRVLANRLTKDGVLNITCQTHRSQHANRREAAAIMSKILTKAARPPKVRRATKPTKASGARRLESKRRRSATKAARRGQRSDRE